MPVAGINPLWSLVPIAVLMGMALLWVLGRWSNQEALRLSKRRVSAHFYELRLFADEPGLIARAMSGLLKENRRRLRLALTPTVIVSIPMMLLCVQLDAFYGWSPLQPGVSANVTVQFNQPLSGDHRLLELQVPDGFEVETDGVRVMRLDQVSWRIRPLRPAAGDLRVNLGKDYVMKSVSSLPGPAYVSRRRVSSAAQLLLHPGEPLLDSPYVTWVEVEYAPAGIEWFGVRLHWLIWLLILSMGAAMILNRRLGVAL